MGDFQLDADKNLLVLDGDLALLDGLDCLHANLMDRLLSSPGSLLHHPDFGGALQDHVGGLPDDETLLQLAAVAKVQILQDPRVASVDRCIAYRKMGTVPSAEDSGGLSPLSVELASLPENTILLIVDLTTADQQPVKDLAFPLQSS